MAGRGRVVKDEAGGKGGVGGREGGGAGLRGQEIGIHSVVGAGLLCSRDLAPWDLTVGKDATGFGRAKELVRRALLSPGSGCWCDSAQSSEAPVTVRRGNEH